jgi:drug/metabolite transporter (DMT)-like permease
MSIAFLWIPFTILASLGQVARNAMQRELTASLGTVGATHVRFLFGFPFAIVFFTAILLVGGESVGWPSLGFWLWLVVGSMTQIVATALMLAAMNERSFVVTTAYIKTEPIQAALFGFIFLADALTVWKVLAIMVATAGVVITAIRPGGAKGFADLRPTLLGLAAGAGFALSAVGYRGAILQVGGVSFVTAASFTLVLGLMLQTIVLTSYLVLREPKTLAALFRLWKPSMLAGFMGAAASQFWFLAFAITSVANVRTLALIEVLFAQAIAYYSLKQRISAREALGIGLIVIGVGALIAVQ